MSEEETKQAAHAFSQAADALTGACRQLESLGLDDPPVDRLYRALEEVTHLVHQMHPPDDRVQFEVADLAGPMACRIAARESQEPGR